MASLPSPALKCPVCSRRFLASASTAPPFCSPRCRQIDLGRWLGESYAVPVERPADDEDAPPAED